MRLKRKDDFMEGICTENGRTKCDICKIHLRIGDKVYVDGLNLEYHLCRDCYGQEDFYD